MRVHEIRLMLLLLILVHQGVLLLLLLWHLCERMHVLRCRCELHRAARVGQTRLSLIRVLHVLCLRVCSRSVAHDGRGRRRGERAKRVRVGREQLCLLRLQVMLVRSLLL